jgi:hypothetical protein
MEEIEMANMSIQYTIAKHATANPSNVLSGGTYGGHMFSIQLESDADNGNLIAVGDYKSLDLFAEAAVTEFEGTVVEKMSDGNYLVMVTNPGDAVLVYQEPVGAEDWTNTWKKESNLYNVAGDVVRCYGLAKYDRFEVSAEGFTKEPTVGDKITGVTNKKMTIA